MSRRKAQLARIKRMLDRALTSPCKPADTLEVYAAVLIDLPFSCADRFVMERGWTSKQIYAITIAFAEIAPASVLGRMARRADIEYREIEQIDAQYAYEEKHGHARLGEVPIYAAWHPDTKREAASP